MWLFFRCFHLVWSICSFCFMRIAIVDIYCIRCRCFVRQYAPPLPVYPPLSSFCYDYFSCLINVFAGFFFLCWLLNFYVHIHWAMACININNLNFVSAHLVGISSVHIYPLYELPSLCDIFFVSFPRSYFSSVSFRSTVEIFGVFFCLIASQLQQRCTDTGPGTGVLLKYRTKEQQRQYTYWKKNFTANCARNANFE